MAVVHRNRAEEVALGMTMLGLAVASLLYGITLTQVYKYYKRFPHDPASTKLLAAAVLILDSISVGFVTHACWYYLVTTGEFHRSVWSLNAELIVSMVLSGIAEGFFAYRVWQFSGHRYVLTIAIAALVLLHLASGEASAIQFLLLRHHAQFSSVKVPTILRLGSAALCDTGIAVSMCYYLRKKRTGSKRTDEVIDRLIFFSINTGLLTSISSISCLITYLFIRRTWLYMALCFLITRLYAMTFFTSLNSRHLLRPSNNDSNTSISANYKPKNTKHSTWGVAEPTRHIDIYVVTETVTEVRDYSICPSQYTTSTRQGSSSSSKLKMSHTLNASSENVREEDFNTE